MASTEASSDISNNNKPNNFAQNCLFLTSSILHNNPFLKPNLLPCSNGVVRQLHSSISSVADECFRILHVFATQNPLLKNILSFTQHFPQIHCCRLRNANSMSNHNFAAVLPDSAASLVVTNGILNFLNIYNTLLVVRLVLTWFPNSPPAIVSPLSTLCDPYLNIFRGIIPPLGGTLDLSPILAFLVLNAFTSTASALPAELPKTEASQENHSSNASLTASTSSQKKWLRRLHGNKSKVSSASGSN